VRVKRSTENALHSSGRVPGSKTVSADDKMTEQKTGQNTTAVAATNKSVNQASAVDN